MIKILHGITGVSKWRSDRNLNFCSIGIELVNNGSEIFPKKQISSLKILLKKLLKKYTKSALNLF